MSDPLPTPSLPPAERWRCESRHYQAPSYLRQSPLPSRAPLPVAFISTVICTRPDNRQGRRCDPLVAPSLPQQRFIHLPSSLTRLAMSCHHTIQRSAPLPTPAFSRHLSSPISIASNLHQRNQATSAQAIRGSAQLSCDCLSECSHP
ncbi:hypothetical protein MRB53_026162 [Persea americana]|uniref:Uncharacterized protein n=1 Tax=Persea americana TaxID=3435 RepID=A0ACC2LHX5_PERAE|nr:hypothetical protein MRB53_026162 [Persea americana]